MQDGVKNYLYVIVYLEEENRSLNNIIKLWGSASKIYSANATLAQSKKLNANLKFSNFFHNETSLIIIISK